MTLYSCTFSARTGPGWRGTEYSPPGSRTCTTRRIRIVLARAVDLDQHSFSFLDLDPHSIFGSGSRREKLKKKPALWFFLLMNDLFSVFSFFFPPENFSKDNFFTNLLKLDPNPDPHYKNSWIRICKN